MNTNELYEVLMIVTTEECQSAFNEGLILGAVIVASCIVVRMILNAVGSNSEEL